MEDLVGVRVADAGEDAGIGERTLQGVVLAAERGGEGGEIGVEGLDAGEGARLHAATREVLTEWTDRLRREAAGGFPEGVTAFRPEMAVHGRHRQPCPVCGTPVQRIVRAENEVNYCPRCQTGGQILSDRSLARLLKEDWPRTIEELERNPALSAPRSPQASVAEAARVLKPRG